MAKINLRDFYPLNTDCIIDVSDEVVAVLFEAERQEHNYIRRMYWNKAHYSLDAGDGIEHKALFVSLSPYELYERKLTTEELYNALNSLPAKQGRRVYAHYILGISQTEIARAEGVSVNVVSVAIERGLKNMKNIFKNSSDLC